MIPEAAVEAKCPSCRTTTDHQWWCGRSSENEWKDGR